MESTANIPFTDFGGSGELIHFAHANGYPAGGYQLLFEELKKEYAIKAMHARPLWDDDYRQLKGWSLFADDLTRFIEHHGMKGVIGMGHSMGGIATMVASAQQPALFKKVILIDPVFLPPSFQLFQLLPFRMQHKYNPMARVSSKRRNRWESKQAVYESWRSKKVFRKIDDQGLRYFVDATIRELDNGEVGLAFSREWETRIYCTGVNMWKYLKKLTVPTLIIRADKSNVLTDPVWNKMQQSAPNVTYITMADSTHLVPLEKPEEVAQHIFDWLRKH